MHEDAFHEIDVVALRRHLQLFLQLLPADLPAFRVDDMSEYGEELVLVSLDNQCPLHSPYQLTLLPLCLLLGGHSRLHLQIMLFLG